MPQQSAPRAAKAKTTQVQKILRDESLRRSVEVSWQREKSQTESLEVLARCKALNEFIRKGLLAEVEDDTAPGQAKSAGRRTSAPTAAARPATSSVTPGTIFEAKASAGSKSSCLSTPAAPRPATTASLASRFTAQESDALLDLLLSDEVAVAAEASTASLQTPAAPAVAAAAAVAAGSCAVTDSSDRCASTETSTCSSSDSPRDSSTGAPSAAGAATDLREVDSQDPTAVSTSSHQPALGNTIDLLDDVIGLLNEPGPSLDMLAAPSNTTCPEAAMPPDQEQQQPCTEMQPKQQQQQQQWPQAAFHPLPPAACREAHRQSYVRPPQQQQEDLRAAATKHASINAAWQGFYNYWGPRAASTIQQYWRAYKARQQYMRLRQAAVVLQAFSRGHLLRAGPNNPVRLHKEGVQRQQQRQQELELQQQREREARQREELLLQQQAEREAGQQLQREHEAAVTLQCAVRGWAARRVHALLAAAAAAAEAAAKQRADSISSVPSACSRGSDSTDSCSRGSSRQSHSRGSTVCSMEASAAPSLTCQELGEVLEESDGVQEQQQWENLQDIQEDVPQYSLPGLVIRHAAEKRTASHGGDGVECREELARQLVQRAGQLGVAEGIQAADLAARTLMASSSSRQLKAAMQVVRTTRPTM